ncbi:hypothetical protein HAX54_016632 [Datura stramonium]|uniref:Uncharacterized protein n=1 Tax=Datura stramonium TaxID=4076 RepID=A0ABS8ULF0_DATST|nr:hypothetical protein [Datura stramonium]
MYYLGNDCEAIGNDCEAIETSAYDAVIDMVMWARPWMARICICLTKNNNRLTHGHTLVTATLLDQKRVDIWQILTLELKERALQAKIVERALQPLRDSILGISGDSTCMAGTIEARLTKLERGSRQTETHSLRIDMEEIELLC